MDGKSGSMKNSIPVWKTYLYQLQLQAPKPKPIQCLKNVPNRPLYYGLEHHGLISRQEAEQLLGNDDGNYLVRESNNPPSSCTLAIKFNNETKNYKVYYDGAFYVGEKRFDNINDLVHDGLISFYIEKHASNYIAMMAEESNYAESPYVASRTALLARQAKEAVVQSPLHSSQSQPAPSTASSSSNSNGGLNYPHHQMQHATELIIQQQQQQHHQRISPPSIHANFQRQHQVQPQQTQFYPVQQQQQFHHHVFQQQHFVPQPHSSTSTLANYQGDLVTTSTALNTMLMDKENRTNTNAGGAGGSNMDSSNSATMTSTSSTNGFNNGGGSNRLINSNFNANNFGIKSNAIFDRFDIMNSEKPHRFKPQNFKGPHWCDFCLNFMWGLVSQGVKCQDCGFQAHKKCSERTPPDCEPQMRFIKRIFGVDLTTLVKATNSIRPVLVEKCIEEIERRKGAIETEGLYRVSGFSDAVDELKMAFDRGEQINFDEFKYNDIHIICSLLKAFLRQLPIPLITFDVYNKLIDAFNTAHLYNNYNNLIESIKACVVELPPAHYLTLKYLMEHLVKVSQYSAKNQMNYENLAIVFGPTLMRSINPDPVLALKNTHKEQKLTELMIANYTNIFEK